MNRARAPERERAEEYGEHGMEKRREKKKKKRHPIVGVTLLCTLLASLCAGALAWFQLNRYEAPRHQLSTLSDIICYFRCIY